MIHANSVIPSFTVPQTRRTVFQSRMNSFNKYKGRTDRQSVVSLVRQTGCYVSIIPQTLLSSPPPSFIAAPPVSALIWGHLSALQPIRQLDVSIPEMAWAWARPEASVRGATGWLVTRGKKTERGGEDIYKY